MKNKILIVSAILLFLIPVIFSSLPTDITITQDMWGTSSTQPTAASSTATDFDVAIVKPDVSKRETFEVDEEIPFEGQYLGPRTADSWRWDFSDNTTALTQTTTHNYSKAGKYEVRLSVIDDGKQANAAIYVTIEEKTTHPTTPGTSECTTILQCLGELGTKFVEDLFKSI